jgi:sporulation protein YqfC
MEKTAELLDLPADRLGRLPRVELVGRTEFRMTPHHGVLSYGPEEIHINGGKLLVRLRGEGLQLRSMTPEDLCITGLIRSLEVE